MHFYFKLYCQNPFASQYVSSVRAVGSMLKGNRRDATVYVDGEYSGLPVSGEGIHQDAFWTMKGKFTGPTHFEGRVESKPRPSRNRLGPWAGRSASTRNFSTSTARRLYPLSSSGS